MDVTFISSQYHHQYGTETSRGTPPLHSTQNKLRRRRNMHRSTSRASKQRRDLINTEIALLRDLLPLPATVKTRLSYLHVMSIACVCIRKGNFFHQQDTECDQIGEAWNLSETRFDFTQALHGFLVAMTSNGKLLYMSENVTDYLGHSMVELLSTGGGIYDVIDSRDHVVVRCHLESNSASGGMERTIFCRMNTSRNMRRRNHCADNKMVHIQGRFMNPNPAGVYPWSYESIFVGLCTPIDVVMPVPNEMAIYNTNMFVTLHGLDMTIKDSEDSVLFHLGYESDELDGCSWYGLVHNDDLQAAVDFHQRVLKTGSNVTGRCVVVLRLMCSDCVDFIAVCITAWLEKESPSSTSSDTTTTPSIVCLNQVIRNDEIHVYQSMHSFFESSAKQSSTPSSPQNGASPTGHDCMECTDWQSTSQNQNEDASMSSWERDGHGCYDCYDGGVYNVAQDHVDERFPSYHQSAWTDDGNRQNLNSEFNGVISDVQNHNLPCELEKSHTKHATDSNVFNSVVLNTHPCFPDSTSVGLIEHPVVGLFLSERPTLSEQLQTFPNLRRLLKKFNVKGLNVKGEYQDETSPLLESNMKEEVNRDEADYKLSRPHTLSSCAYGDSGMNVQKVIINHIRPARHFNFDYSTDYQNELTSDVLARVNSEITNSESCITSCVKLLSDQVVYPLKQTSDVENNVVYETLSNLGSTMSASVIKQRTLLDVSIGKHKTAAGDASVGDSLRHAVGQAIGMLSSDQLHLLDEAICSMLPSSRASSRVKHC